MLGDEEDSGDAD